MMTGEERLRLNLTIGDEEFIMLQKALGKIDSLYGVDNYCSTPMVWEVKFTMTTVFCYWCVDFANGLSVTLGGDITAGQMFYEDKPFGMIDEMTEEEIKAKIDKLNGVKSDTNEIDEPSTCKFDKAWIGICGVETIDGSSYCEEHDGKKCRKCDSQATHECSIALQFVCGAPLCDEHSCNH